MEARSTELKPQEAIPVQKPKYGWPRVALTFAWLLGTIAPLTAASVVALRFAKAPPAGNDPLAARPLLWAAVCGLVYVSAAVSRAGMRSLAGPRPPGRDATPREALVYETIMVGGAVWGLYACPTTPTWNWILLGVMVTAGVSLLMGFGIGRRPAAPGGQS